MTPEQTLDFLDVHAIRYRLSPKTGKFQFDEKAVAHYPDLLPRLTAQATELARLITNDIPFLCAHCKGVIREKAGYCRHNPEGGILHYHVFCLKHVPGGARDMDASTAAALVKVRDKKLICSFCNERQAVRPGYPTETVCECCWQTHSDALAARAQVSMEIETEPPTPNPLRLVDVMEGRKR